MLITAMRFVTVVIVALVLVACGHGAGTRIGTPAEERCDFDDMVGGQVEPGAKEPLVLPNKKAWEAALGGKEAARAVARAPARAGRTRSSRRAAPADDGPS